jgi:hypothetical protein
LRGAKNKVAYYYSNREEIAAKLFNVMGLELHV